ncbi:MAG TPA: glycosyltransferase family 2 protein, partial [Bryobacteraceae bacterium]|nr:glycosyltransferase family 2 protein [Bryobacteraceae bacterium]
MRFTEFGQTVHALIPRPDPQLLSIVIPAYNEGPTVPFLRAELTQFIDGLPFRSEVVIVNDGSSDETLPRLLEWALDDPRIRVVHLSRNFGHQIAATAGLDKASGDAIVLIDADLQDPLPVILSMLERYREGYDVVYGQRESRDGESAFKLATAWIFYRLMRTLVYKSLPPDVGDFRLLSRQCLDALRHMREQHRFLRGMVTWVGYSQTAVRYKRAKRVAG